MVLFFPRITKTCLSPSVTLLFLSSSGHFHTDQPDAHICSDFLLGKCKKGIKCSEHHCSLPYHWQYRVENKGVWKSFSETDNEKVEKLYCDAMMNDCLATGFKLSFKR